MTLSEKVDDPAEQAATGRAGITSRTSDRGVVFCANTLKYLLNFRRSTLEQFLAQGVRVLCIGQDDRAADELRGLGCEVLPLPWRLRTLNPLHEAGIVLRILRGVARFGPIVCYSFTFQANAAIAAVSTLLRIPYVTNISGLGTAFLNDRLSYRLLRRLYGPVNAGAYATFFQNPSDLELFRSLKLSVGRRTAVLPGSGVDTLRFAFQRLTGPVRTFLMVSRLLVDKGVREYLTAAAQVKAARPDLRFVLVGPEEAGPGCISIEEVRTYAESVDYLGEVRDVRPHLYASECLVLPSYREGMPRTVLEAASAGRIALVSDVDGCRHAVEDRVTGFLFEPRSAAKLAEALIAVADLNSLQVLDMSRKAGALARCKFSESYCIEPYLQLFDEIASV